MITLTDYEIINDRLESEYTRHLPEEVDKQLPGLNSAIYSEPEKIIETLEYLKNKYGPLPILYNYLSAAYMYSGQQEIAEKYINENYAKYPEYFFAKMNYADLCLLKKQFNEIPKIFDHKFDLKSCYPLRRKFHISEFVGFYSIMCMYFYGIQEITTAKIYYEDLNQVAPGHTKTKEIKQMLYPSIFRRLLILVARKFKKLNS